MFSDTSELLSLFPISLGQRMDHGDTVQVYNIFMGSSLRYGE